MFLVSVILAKWWTPISRKQNIKAQTTLAIGFISAAADFYDLIDYNNFAAIVDVIGAEPILSEFL